MIGHAQLWSSANPAYKSYADLCNEKEHDQRHRKPVFEPSGQSQVPAAGTPSNAQLRGAGSFLAQNTWSLTTVPQSSIQKTTEIRSQFKPPPENYQRRGALRTDQSNFPMPNDPHDFKTTTQLDFGKNLLKQPGYQRCDLVRPPPSKNIIPQDCATPLFTTQNRTDFQPRQARQCTGNDATSLTGKSVKAYAAGAPAAHNTGYNIITGGKPLSNNVFEQWDGRDYRMHR